MAASQTLEELPKNKNKRDRKVEILGEIHKGIIILSIYF